MNRTESVTTRRLPAFAILLLAVVGPKTQAATISGVVLDAQTQAPVPYAEVQVEGHEPVLTDSTGSFRVETDSGVLNLRISRVGYHAQSSVPIPPSSFIVYLQPLTLNLDPVTVTAARTPLPVSRAGAVRVLDHDRLALHQSDPADAVRTVSSALARDYANYSSIGLRGAGAEHTIVALDGVPQNSAQNSTFDLSTLPLVVAERLEVARGAASAVFGSSAVGGVVNVITPVPERLGARVSGGLGSFGQRRLDFRHSNWYHPIGYLVAGQLYSCRNGFFWRDTLDSLHMMSNADLTRRCLLAKTRYEYGPHQASLLGEFSATARGVPGTTDWPSDSARRDDTRAQLIAGYSLRPSGSVRTSARGHLSRIWQNYRDPAWAANDTHAANTAGVAIDGSWQATRHTDLLLAGEATAENLSSTAVGWPRRNTVAGILQFRVQALGFDVVHVFRYEWLRSKATLLDSTERHSTERVFSPKVTATFTRLRVLDLYTAVGRSFRAPSFNDLYWPADAFAYGNPRLRAETGSSCELGAKARPLRGLSCHASGFLSRLTDLIQWQYDSLGRSSPVNVNRAVILGAELELAYEMKTVGAEFSGAFTQAHGDTLDLLYRPRWTGAVAAWYQPRLPVFSPRFTVRAAYTGTRMANDTLSLPGFALVDVGLGTKPRLGRVELDAGAGIRNLLDTGYETILGYPNAGRNWYAELGLGL